MVIYGHLSLVGGWATPLKNMTSLGMMRFPIVMGTFKKWQPVTTNQGHLSYLLAPQSLQLEASLLNWNDQRDAGGSPEKSSGSLLGSSLLQIDPSPATWKSPTEIVVAQDD